MSGRRILCLIFTKGEHMDGNIRKRNDLLAQKVIKGLESRNMTGYYAHSKEEALETALSRKAVPLRWEAE